MKYLRTLIALSVLSTAAFADPISWEVTGSQDFGTLDLTTGSFSGISTFGFQADGLGEIGNNLYTADSGGTTLYSVNPKTGMTTAIGTSSTSYYVFGSTNSALYTVDSNNGLWSIDPATGASTFIGSTQLLIGSNTIALSSGSSTLYLALGSNMYTINTSTGVATPIGTTAGTAFGGIVDIRGQIYGASTIGANSVYSFNQATGTSKFITNSNNPDYSWGLAPAVPEPGSLGMLALAGTLLGGYAMTRRKRA